MCGLNAKVEKGWLTNQPTPKLAEYLHAGKLPVSQLRIENPNVFKASQATSRDVGENPRMPTNLQANTFDYPNCLFRLSTQIL